jgi:ABC-2 type transport system ATP-binding protein
MNEEKNANSSVLSLDNITKSYGPVQALKGVSFQVPEGSVYGILGPNGSGKTTLLSIILDVLKANKGNFLWFGHPGSKEQRQKIGSLLETPNFYHYLSAVNNLKITQSISGRGTLKDIDEVLKKVRLYERRNSRFSTFSLGMKQRLAIAASLLGDPKVLVFDEPTNGLDPVGIAEIRELIIELKNNGHTVIMASHLLDEVEKVCTHAAILRTGELLTTGRVEEILVDDDVVELSAPDLNALAEILKQLSEHVVTDGKSNTVQITLPKGTAKLDEINSFCFKQGIVLNHLILKKKRLEARFFELTNN